MGPIMDRSATLWVLLGFVLGALTLDLFRPVPETPAAPEPHVVPESREREAAHTGAQPTRATDAPNYAATPAGRPPAAQDPDAPPSEAALTFARTMGQMLQLRAEAGASFDPEAFGRDHMELFCEFDGSMNAMTTGERQAVIDSLGFTRDILVGKNHLVFHGCPLPLHVQCPGEPGAPAE